MINYLLFLSLVVWSNKQQRITTIVYLCTNFIIYMQHSLDIFHTTTGWNQKKITITYMAMHQWHKSAWKPHNLHIIICMPKKTCLLGDNFTGSKVYWVVSHRIKTSAGICYIHICVRIWSLGPL